MATLTIRNLPDEVRNELRLRAARNGRSMEAEVRLTLVEATASRQIVPAESKARLAKIRAMLAPLKVEGHSFVDDLIEERRREAANEEAEFQQLDTLGRAASKSKI